VTLRRYRNFNRNFSLHNVHNKVVDLLRGAGHAVEVCGNEFTPTYSVTTEAAKTAALVAEELISWQRFHPAYRGDLRISETTVVQFLRQLHDPVTDAGRAALLVLDLIDDALVWSTRDVYRQQLKTIIETATQDRGETNADP